MPSKRALTVAIEDDIAEKRLIRLAMLDSKLRRRFSKKGTSRKKKDEILAKIAALANLRDEIISSFEHQEEPEETVLDGRDNVRIKNGGDKESKADNQLLETQIRAESALERIYGIKHGGTRNSSLHYANLTQKSQEGLAELRLERIYGIKQGGTGYYGNQYNVESGHNVRTPKTQEQLAEQQKNRWSGRY